MANEDNIKSGYWAIAAHKHIKGFTTDSSNLDEIDNLSTAGKSGRFLGVIRGNREINKIKKLEKMAGSVGIQKNELHLVILPKLEEASDQKVEIIRDTSGYITGISEYIFSNQDVLEIAGQVFENQDPSDLERIAINTMDETKKIPYLQNDLIQLLVKQGYAERDIELALALQTQFKLIQKLSKSQSKDAIISNEYVWGPNHQKIAMAVSSLELGKKQSLKEVVEIVRETQGFPIEKLPPLDESLLVLAKKTGMINPITIISSRGIQKEFVFSPNMLEPLTYNDDILDDVKLLLASIRFGENYTPYSKITDAVKFLNILIRNGEIGPHDANATDYTLLEKKGIVKVVHKSVWNSYLGRYRTGYFLELVRKDVALEALKVIENAGYNIKVDTEVEDFSSVLDTGTFITAEETRIKLGESPEHIKEAEDYLSRVLRDELL
ncbi:hypothetical protein [Ruminiclostridium papyrosolvens]|uniref:Uncharacterized protein n=1 Tax=Ruminiclostridium papyrosolvens C7 TaxID=1330534 RepID=U4R2W3_9FIRM|nr:hypothetical protein [Ruminiclostridium papyrosolvens]EPR12047.1 hypothetical protein L323_09850 [Ruminiclostridium papyrosolvens C7]